MRLQHVQSTRFGPFCERRRLRQRRRWQWTWNLFSRPSKRRPKWKKKNKISTANEQTNKEKRNARTHTERRRRRMDLCIGNFVFLFHSVTNFRTDGIRSSSSSKKAKNKKNKREIQSVNFNWKKQKIKNWNVRCVRTDNSSNRDNERLNLLFDSLRFCSF